MSICSASYQKYILQFKRPAGTSRGVYNEKESWLIALQDESGRIGLGECGILRGLSCDDKPEYESMLAQLLASSEQNIPNFHEVYKAWPSIRFGFETALKSLQSEDPYTLFPSKFTEGKEAIPINALIWMGDKDYMLEQIKEKLQQNILCIKMKIGAINFDQEIELIRDIRKQYTAQDVEIRVDANGAFSPQNVRSKLDELAKYQIHSIEQPIAQGQVEEMARLTANTSIPIALDEELIGVNDFAAKKELIKAISPQYIILKPSLLGGFQSCDEWVSIAEADNIPWWATSALESNIGLNAIAQWAFTKNNPMVQGLGTGSLYTNNFDCPLYIKDMKLHYDPKKAWQTIKFQQ